MTSISTLSRGIKKALSTLSIVSILALSTGCSSMPDFVKEGVQEGIWKSGPNRMGERIPNMEGDWDRFCLRTPHLCG
jgi:hypothetical protein